MNLDEATKDPLAWAAAIATQDATGMAGTVSKDDWSIWNTFGRNGERGGD